VLRDDGVIVHLNGNELFRMNMPGGPFTYTTFASTTVGGADESAFYSTNISPAGLIAGTNVLAVELHQSATNTTDAGFDLSLIALAPRAAAPRLTISYSTNHITLSWSPANARLESAPTLSGPWNEVTPQPTNPYTFNPAAVPARSFFRLRR
jgi:hypothetical protein